MISFSNSPRFAHVGENGLDSIEAMTKLDQFQPGEEVWAAGRSSDWLGILCNGELELRLPGASGEVVVGRLGPGDVYGEMETFADPPEGLRLVAARETLVRVCPKHPLKAELKQSRSLAIGLLFAYARSMSEKIRGANAMLLAHRGTGASVPPPSRLGRGDRPPHLREDEATWLSLLGRLVEVPVGEPVVREGDASRSFYVVDTGEVEVRKATEGGEIVLARFGRHDMFGLLAFLDGQPRSASVVPIGGPGRFVEVESGTLDAALKVNFTVAFKFLGALCVVLGRTFSDTARDAARSAS